MLKNVWHLCRNFPKPYTKQYIGNGRVCRYVASIQAWVNITFTFKLSTYQSCNKTVMGKRDMFRWCNQEGSSSRTALKILMNNGHFGTRYFSSLFATIERLSSFRDWKCIGNTCWSQNFCSYYGGFSIVSLIRRVWSSTVVIQAASNFWK